MMCLIFLLMCAEFEGNPIMRLRVMAVFLQVCEKKRKRNECLFEGLYFKNGWRDLLHIWYVYSPDMLAPAQ